MSTRSLISPGRLQLSAEAGTSVPEVRARGLVVVVVAVAVVAMVVVVVGRW